MAAQVFIGIARHVLFTENLEDRIASLVVISALVVLCTVVRDRNERRLTQSRSVAGVAQQVLLRPLPAHSGPLEIASLYLAAEEEAVMGGDLFAAARTTSSTRLIIGDVRGKGLPAYSHAALILGAFRAAAHREATLPRLAVHLDGAVRGDSRQWHSAPDLVPGADTAAAAPGGVPASAPASDPASAPASDPASAPASDPASAPASDGDPAPAAPVAAPDPVADPVSPVTHPVVGPTLDTDETFATVILLDIPDRRPVVHTATCGHPPPLLLSAGQVRTLAAERPALPIGLGGLPGAPDCEVESFPFEPGDLLLLYTDGVSEARDDKGAFYPLVERAAAWSDCSPQQVLRQLRTDLLAHTNGRLGDDAAAVAVRHLPVRPPSD
ncbi:PP2C family protein-serine/threonine phosphatase [Streptomyces tubercidicus]|uniref:PP2C family protein-serine/threonine phosphatase n=1 Tax=Streptomyces tubercidicus TaxID=47759 RepID=UPI002E19F785